MFVIRPLQFILRFMDSMMRTAANAGVDVIDLRTNKARPGDRGYFTLLEMDVNLQDNGTGQREWGDAAEAVGEEYGVGWDHS